VEKGHSPELYTELTQPVIDSHRSKQSVALVAHGTATARDRILLSCNKTVGITRDSSNPHTTAVIHTKDYRECMWELVTRQYNEIARASAHM
jgi:hypothetical protein